MTYSMALHTTVQVVPWELKSVAWKSCSTASSLRYRIASNTFLIFCLSLPTVTWRAVAMELCASSAAGPVLTWRSSTPIQWRFVSSSSPRAGLLHRRFLMWIESCLSFAFRCELTLCVVSLIERLVLGQNLETAKLVQGLRSHDMVRLRYRLARSRK